MSTGIMQGRRVVITGTGVISPVGNDTASFWTSLSEGRSGIGPLENVSLVGQEMSVGAQVQGFDPLVYMDRKEALLLQARTEINEAVNAAQPANDDELRTLLNAMTEEAPEQTAKRDDALLQEFLPQLNEADRRDFVAALELNDAESIRALLARLPVEVRTKFGALAA